MPVSARREAAIGITVDPSKMDAGVEGARRKMRKLRKDVEDDEEDGVKKKKKKKPLGEESGDFFKGVVRQLGARATDGLLGAMHDAATSTFDVEKALVRLQIVGNMSGDQIGSFRQKLTEVSNATGLNKQAILDGTSAYIDLTGDVAGATKGMSQFARIAQASDTSMADVTSAAATMMDAMHVKPEDFEAVFSGLINQGKAGAVTLKNMAGEFPELLARFARFGEMGASGTLELGAMFQVVRKGFGSSNEAATGLKGLMDGLKKHADRFSKGGVEVFNVGKDGTKTFRPLSQILTQLESSKLMKDPQALAKAFGKGEGEAAYNMLTTHLDLLKQLETAGQDAGTVERDLATYSQSSAGRIEIAWNAVKNKFAEAFTPERVQAFASALEGVGSVLGAIGSKLGDLFDTWQKIRDATGDPHELAHDIAAGAANATPEQLDRYATELEAHSKQNSTASKGAHFMSDDTSGNVLFGLAGVNTGWVRVAENDAFDEAAAKMRRNAANKRSAASNAAGHAAVLAGAGFGSDTGDFSSSSAGSFDYGAMGQAVGKAVAVELAKSPLSVSLGGDHAAAAVKGAPSSRAQRPRS